MYKILGSLPESRNLVFLIIVIWSHFIKWQGPIFEFQPFKLISPYFGSASVEAFRHLFGILRGRRAGPYQGCGHGQKAKNTMTKLLE